MRMKELFIISSIILLAVTIIYIGIYVIQEKSKIPILLYHHILKDEENINFRGNGAVISLEQFEEQMKFLYNNGYQSINLNELYDYIYLKKELPDKSFMITFDDGYLSNYVYAYPILKKYGFNATIFLITSNVPENEGVFNPNALNILDWQTINEMKDVFEFCSHTHDMHKKVENTPVLLSEKRDSILKDLKVSLEYPVENIGFSYPFGAHDEKVMDTFKELDVKLAFTIEEGYVTQWTNPYTINRFIIDPQTSYDRFQEIMIAK
ncbi:polysaccharide deacetylase family protein [Wukongibacter baidiensis]|uniref:polysaccharide deacetylase family protein n=1 Tax=Wukongibacter baidiensis TaxID=1723361 RepID=UPI003D7F5B10